MLQFFVTPQKKVANINQGTLGIIQKKCYSKKHVYALSAFMYKPVPSSSTEVLSLALL